jgi:SAM-dependent methyltransferase
MRDSTNWRRVWEEKSHQNVSDFELDRGRSPHQQEIERLSERELVDFIGLGGPETVLDAGCGTGVNICRFYSQVKTIIGIDYAFGSLGRCKHRIQAQEIMNSHLCMASVCSLPLPERSVNRILCLSVLQYLDDNEVRQVLKEFARVSGPAGVIIVHVKNSSSLYWLTLRLAKRLKSLLGRPTRVYYLRPFRWYQNELASLNCRVVDYNSFNLLTLEGMPTWLVAFLQKFELEHYSSPLFRVPFVRRHGADLKIKATVEQPGAELWHSGMAAVSPEILTPNAQKSC